MACSFLLKVWWLRWWGDLEYQQRHNFKIDGGSVDFSQIVYYSYSGNRTQLQSANEVVTNVEKPKPAPLSECERRSIGDVAFKNLNVDGSMQRKGAKYKG